MAETNPSFSKIVRRWFTVAASVFALTVIAGMFVIWFWLPVRYAASAEIEIRPAGEKMIDGLDHGNPDRSFDPTSFQAEFEIIQSPDVLLPIVHDLQLDRTWAKKLKLGTDQMKPLDALARLKSMLKLDLKRQTDIVEITVTSDNPTEAADIANAVADRYKTMRDVQEDMRNSRGAESLQDQVEQQKKVVEDKKKALDLLREKEFPNGLSLTPGTSDQLQTDLEERKKDLLAAQVDYDARRVLWEQTKDLPDDEFVNTLSALGRQDSNLGATHDQIDDLKNQLDKLAKTGAKSSDAQFQQIDDELGRKKATFKDLIAGTRRAMQVDMEMAKSRVALLQKEVDMLTAKIEPANPAQDAYRHALRDYEEQQSIFEALSLRLKQVQTDKQLLISPVRIITRASPPVRPSYPNKPLCLLITVVAGAFAGAGVATVVELGFWVVGRKRREV